MINVRLVLSFNGALSSFEAKGHAQKGLRGYDIVCASVTVLMRTTLAVLEGSIKGLLATSSGPGMLSVKIPETIDEYDELLQYAGRFLQMGLDSLQREYPDAVQVQLIQK